MSENQNQSQPTDSNKAAAEMNCELKVGKCLSSGAKTAEEVQAAIECLKKEAASQ